MSSDHKKDTSPNSSNGHSNSPRRLLIIGAGPTALGALYRFCQLKSHQHLIDPNDIEVLILEQENEVGGLARSVTDEHGFTWDLGVHVMGISKYPDFVDALAKCVPEWRTVPRCAMVFSCAEAIFFTKIQADMSHVNVMKTENESENDGRKLAENFYVPYPVQNSIPYFPEELKQKCLEELLANNGECDGNGRQQSMTMTKSKMDQNFGEFSLSLFGPTLQRIFIKPYNEKVWTVPIGEMGISWLQGRVPLTDRAELARRCALSPRELVEEDGQRQTAFRYPAECRGVSQMWHRFASQFPAECIRLGHHIMGIEPKEKLVKAIIIKEGETKAKTKDNEEKEKNVTFHYDWLISTMPLTVLGELSGLAPGLPLKYSTVILVGIGLNGGQSHFARQLSWAYYPRPEIIFYRCTILSNFSPELVPAGGGPCSSSSSTELASSSQPNQFWSALCEIGQNSGAEMPKTEAQKKEIVDRVIQDLIRVGIIRSRADCHSNWMKCLQYGYPIPTRNRDAVLAECHEKLEANQIYSRGRFGGWRYEISNQDHSFQSGLELVDRIFLGIPETLCAPPSK